MCSLILISASSLLMAPAYATFSLMGDTRRHLVIRRGPVYYEWRYLEEHPSKFRTLKLLSTMPPKDASDLVAHEFLQLSQCESLVVLWERTPDEQQQLLESADPGSAELLV